MSHFANPDFWRAYGKLPTHIQSLADRSFGLFKQNPHYPSLHFKKVGEFRSVRIGIDYRALAVEVKGGLLWFWIGFHDEYDRLIK